MEARRTTSRRAIAEEQGAESPAFEVRVRKFKTTLQASNVNLEELKRLTNSGIPDKDGIRALAWKVVLSMASFVYQLSEAS